MRKFVSFFGLVIVLDKLDYKVIVVLNNLSYLEIVFLNYYYYFDCFCWVLNTFVVHLVVLPFLSAFGNAVSVSSAINAPFFN